MTVLVPTAERMHDLASHVAAACRPGDLLVLIGDLGAGKTTFVQGMGRALGVTEPVTSPTFVIARVYPAARAVNLVHVDAYRLASSVDLDDLDLDADLDTSVTVVEWGEGKVEQLSPDRLAIRIVRSDDDADDARLVSFEGHGQRWTSATVAALETSW